MDVHFQDEALALIETDRAYETRLPVPVINAFRQKLVTIRAAPDERTLRNWKSLHFEKLKGDLAGKYSIRLNQKWRLVFSLSGEEAPTKMTILSIEDYH